MELRVINLGIHYIIVQHLFFCLTSGWLILGLDEGGGGSSSSNHSSEEELWCDWTLVRDASLEIKRIREKARRGGFAVETEHDLDLHESVQLPRQLFTFTSPTFTSTIEAE